SDGGSEQEMIDLHETARRRAIRPSWFLHVEAHLAHLGTIKKFNDDGDELGVHCYRHKAYTEREAIIGNITEAAAVLRAAGIEPTGYAAPNGRWSRELDLALNIFELPYSS